VPQQEDPIEPQQEGSTEPQEELAEPQPEEFAIHNQGDSNNPPDYTPLSDPDDSGLEPEPVRAAIELCSYDEESSTVPTQLHGLLFQLGITRALEYRVKGGPRLGCMEFTCTVEVFDGQEVVGKHACCNALNFVKK
jgi:hypothetical protein